MPRKAEHLTLTELKKMRAKADKDPDYSAMRADGKEPGLTAQARRGRVEFKYRYLSPVTRQRRTVLIGEFGDYPLEPAREKAAEYRRQVALGLDPQEVKVEEARQSLTLKDAVKLYLDDLEERATSGAGKRGKRSGYASAKRLLERNVLPRLGARRVLDVTSEDVRKLHRGMKSKSQANRSLTALSAVFGHLDRRELIPAGTNPARFVERHREDGQRRALTAEELERLGEVLATAERTGKVTVTEDGKTKSYAAHSSAVLAVRLLALTGMRAAEVLGHGTKARRNGREGLRWGDVDLDRGLAHLADTKAGGRQTRVLGAAAVALLKAAKPADAKPDWAVCPGKMARDKPFAGMGRIRRQLWEAAGIVATPEGKADLHSARHAYATVGAHLHSGRYIGAVAPLLGHGHQGRSVTERYISANPEALRPAADAIAGEIARILGLGEPGKVLEHPASRRRKSKG
ncbi:MAG TPA: integrase arm-type DNA-binding domain-containing protein [Thermoanaerobaculia bacterium]|nr:integrase arm-type DNA-binding domain-containing protein [Thermoanaerobaculia bacterium]